MLAFGRYAVARVSSMGSTRAPRRREHPKTEDYSAGELTLFAPGLTYIDIVSLLATNGCTPLLSAANISSAAKSAAFLNALRYRFRFFSHFTRRGRLSFHCRSASLVHGLLLVGLIPSGGCGVFCLATSL